ncbi:MAG TPA: CocE/NonD family hydrolase, partial [Cryptosporangiaceae bacterium]|nr:CocE/NonD family hydrolase [Cryptosporangiaceae bacterium]
MRRSLATAVTTVISVIALLAIGMPALAAPPEGRGRPADDPGRGRGRGGPPAAEEEEAGPPMDYIAQADQLSQPNYAKTVTDVVQIPAYDGEDLYVEITKPDPAEHGNGPWPVILEASPYHGTIATRIGDRMFPDPKDAEGNRIGLTGYFAPRGYAVAMMDLRGTGRSQGCLDHLGPDDAKDLKTVIEWLADAEWSNGKVGMTGHSYVGSTPSTAAAQNPRGLATIVPSAGLASMYDHQFNKGVPWLLQWVGPMAAYPALSIDRDLPPGLGGFGGHTGDNFEYRGPNPQTGCGLLSSAAISGSGQVTGQYELWHAKRDWRRGASEAEIPVFMIHGVHDNAARIPAAEWFFGNRFDRDQDKVWIGQWDHGSTNGRCGDEDGARALHPTCRFDQMKYAIHAWFDKHLMGSDVDTGPAVEAFLNGEQPQNLTEVRDPAEWGTKVVTGTSWSRPTTGLGLYPDATDMSLDFAPPADAGSATFDTGANAVLLGARRGRVEFKSEPVAEDTVFLGLPQMRLNASVSANQIVHLITTLYREDAAGKREPMTFCGIQPQLRYGVETIAPVVPRQEMELPQDCFTMASWIPAGQRLVMDVSGSSRHHATFGGDPQVTVFTGTDRTAQLLPTVEGATLYDDVRLREFPKVEEDYPIGPAQAPISGSVIVPVSGAGVQVQPVTAASFEFDAEEGFDNAALDVLAKPDLPADLDLYLQRQDEDGSWSKSLAAGESSSTSEETLTYGRTE